MAEPAFIRRAKLLKKRFEQDRARSEEVKINRQLAQAVAVKLYEIEQGFHTCGVARVKEWLDTRKEEMNCLIADLIRMPTSDPKVAELQGRIKAIHEIVSPPVDPKELTRIPTQEAEEEDA